MSKYTIEISEECSKILKPIIDYTKQEPNTIVEDLIKTVCDMPFIIASDLEEFCIKKLDEYSKNDAFKKSSFTIERLEQYRKIQFFIDIIYRSQAKQLK